uniref:Uncharacterized protein n=1 Tax=Tetraselmis sp. GSL018 TaxID=582737 RepID=A0A061RF71_9CHLO|mmetsp:Transcript_31062/g.73836  ORF Transcript_31062/g.73836 Transcript_31062/m.73836 type:complete len:863 (-) Transcript_31062:225-2813(-)
MSDFSRYHYRSGDVVVERDQTLLNAFAGMNCFESLWALTPERLKRMCRKPLFMQIFLVNLVFLLITTIYDTYIVLKAVSTGCSSVLRAQVELNCLHFQENLYTILNFKAWISAIIFYPGACFKLIFQIIIRLRSSRVGPCPKTRRNSVENQFSETEKSTFALLWSRCKPCASQRWSLVSTRDTFLETSLSLRSMVKDFSFLVLTYTFCSVLPFLLGLKTGELDWRKDVLVKTYLTSVCGRNFSLCHFAYISRRFLMITSTSFAVFVVVLYLLIPLECYQPLTFVAARRTSDKFLLRLLRTAPFGFLVFASPPVLYTLNSLHRAVASQEADEFRLQAFALVSLLHPVLGWMYIFWILEGDSFVSRTCFRKKRTTVASTTCDNLYFEAKAPRRLWSLRRAAYYCIAFENGSRSHRQGILAELAVVCFINIGHGFSVAVYVTTWALRAIFLTLLVFQQDPENEFQDLESSGPGFGLVVDARDLGAALEAALDGHSYKGTFRRYKGNMWRMQQTLAISYRWQPRFVKLSSRHSLGVNMSAWQMRKLREGIALSGCHYVWIDILALPQQDCQLKDVLLSRMMAVYSNAEDCLVLRTREEAGSRYHQRAWTFQEWCSARRLHVVTEEARLSWGGAGAVELESGCGGVAVTVAEELAFKASRRWHELRAGSTKPLWLTGGLNPDLTDEEVRLLWSVYLRLSQRLRCLVPYDKIRAVYPLLFNTPASTHEELAKLVDDVADRVAKAAAAAAGSCWISSMEAPAEGSDRLSCSAGMRVRHTRELIRRLREHMPYCSDALSRDSSLPSSRSFAGAVSLGVRRGTGIIKVDSSILAELEDSKARSLSGRSGYSAGESASEPPPGTVLGDPAGP